jgi:hypothetical protein
MNKNIICIIGISLLILLNGCDKIKCTPQFALDGTYIGIKCGGDW